MTSKAKPLASSAIHSDNEDASASSKVKSRKVISREDSDDNENGLSLEKGNITTSTKMKIKISIAEVGDTDIPVEPKTRKTRTRKMKMLENVSEHEHTGKGSEVKLIKNSRKRALARNMDCAKEVDTVPDTGADYALMQNSKKKESDTNATIDCKNKTDSDKAVPKKIKKSHKVKGNHDSQISIKIEQFIDDSSTMDNEKVDLIPALTEPKSFKEEEQVKVKKERLDPEQVKEQKHNTDSTLTTSPSKKKIKSGEKFVGAHVSIAGGLENAILSAKAINGQALGMFLTSARRWSSKPLEEDAVLRFRQACQDFNFPVEMILPHGSYLVNCGSPDKETLRKSRGVLVDELQRCDKLGIPLYNFHPGSTCGKITREECIERIAESINLAHQQTKYVITVIENMCCQGHTIGGKFSELAAIIDHITDKSRVGVCLDTCHAFAAGYDLTTDEGFEAMMTEFDQVVGFGYLKALHVNDSKGKRGCHKDRHEDIGKGFIGLDGFRRVMNDPRFDNIPMVLETRGVITYSKQIKILYSLRK